jgi:hypothetical protein
MSFLYSSADHARTVRVRTFPSELIASANLATLSPLGASTTHIHQQVNVTEGGQAVVAGDKVTSRENER